MYGKGDRVVITKPDGNLPTQYNDAAMARHSAASDAGRDPCARRNRTRTPVFVLGALAVLLSGCKPEIHVRPLSLQLPAPVFGLAMDGYSHARFTEARVVGADGDVLWSIRAEVPGVLSGGSEIVYGAPPEGFATLQGPVPLEAGVTYRLVVAGKGFGQTEFTPTGYRQQQ